MKTTVIIPVYNRPTTLPLAVRSLQEQKADVDLDILIVDDGSTDETPLVIGTLCSTHPEVRVVRRDNGGVASARNTGLENIAADAEVVTFLDSDDTMAPGRFRADLAILRDRPEVDVTYGDLVATNDIDAATLLPAQTAITRQLTMINLGCGLYRRSLIGRIGLFDPAMKYAEDTDYLLRIFESGTEFVQTETNCLYYLKHEGGLTQNYHEVNRYLAIAVMKSIKRRKADPTLTLVKPSFNIEFPPGLL